MHHRTAYVAIWWRVVESALIEVVFLLADNLRTVELAEDGEQGASVPVVSDTTAVVALTSQVRQSNVLHVLYRITPRPVMSTVITAVT